MEDLTGIGKLGVVIVEKLADATGGALAPYQIKRVEKAKAEADAYGAVVKTKSDIEVERLRREAAIETASDEQLLRRASERVARQEVKNQANLEHIVVESLQMADKIEAESIDIREIDDDWIMAFIDYAKNISSEEIRSLWAKILAQQGAEGRPSVSRATLDSLRLVESRQAAVFVSGVQQYLGLGQIMDLNPFDDGSGAFNVHLHEAMALEELGFFSRGPSREYAIEFHDCIFTFWQPMISLDATSQLVDWLADNKTATQMMKEHIWEITTNKHPDSSRVRADIRIVRFLMTSRGFELAATLIEDFYSLIGDTNRLNEGNAGAYASSVNRSQALSNWAADFSSRGVVVVLNHYVTQEGPNNEQQIVPKKVFNYKTGDWVEFDEL